MSWQNWAQEHQMRVSVPESGQEVVTAQVERYGVSKGRGLRPRPRPCDAICFDVYVLVTSRFGGTGIDHRRATQAKTL